MIGADIVGFSHAFMACCGRIVYSIAALQRRWSQPHAISVRHQKIISKTYLLKVINTDRDSGGAPISANELRGTVLVIELFLLQTAMETFYDERN